MDKLILLQYGVNEDFNQVKLKYDKFADIDDYTYAPKYGMIEKGMIKLFFFNDNTKHSSSALLDFLWNCSRLFDFSNAVDQALIQHYAQLVLNGNYEIIKVDESYLEKDSERIDLLDSEHFIMETAIINYNQILVDYSSKNLSKFDKSYYYLSLIGLLYNCGEIQKENPIKNLYSVLRSKGIVGEDSRMKSFIKQTMFNPGNNINERTFIKRMAKNTIRKLASEEGAIGSFSEYCELINKTFFSDYQPMNSNVLLDLLIQDNGTIYVKRFINIVKKLTDYSSQK